MISSLDLDSITGHLGSAREAMAAFSKSDSQADLMQAIEHVESAVREMRRELTPNEEVKTDVA